jgi:hypothetical protein
MTAAELASKLSLTRQAVSKLARRGMPLDSVEAAQQWRAVHAPPRKSYAVAKADKAATPFEDSLSRLERAQACEEYFYQTLRQAAEGRDLRLTAKLGKDFLIAATRAAEAEQAAIAAGLQFRDLIRVGDIMDEYNSIIRPFLSRCDQAANVKGCEWYLTPDAAAKEMFSVMDMFFRRLSPKATFTPHENETEKA